jgi:hypothetical protein
MDSIGGEVLDAFAEHKNFILGQAHQQAAAGEVSANGVSGANAAYAVLNGIKDANQLKTLPTGHGAGPPRLVRGCEEVDGIQKNVSAHTKTDLECLDLVPVPDEVV